MRIAPHQEALGMDVNIKKAAAVIDGRVSEDGRIYGLKKFAGRTVKVVVLEEEKP